LKILINQLAPSFVQHSETNIHSTVFKTIVKSSGQHPFGQPDHSMNRHLSLLLLGLTALFFSIQPVSAAETNSTKSGKGDIFDLDYFANIKIVLSRDAVDSLRKDKRRY